MLNITRGSLRDTVKGLVSNHIFLLVKLFPLFRNSIKSVSHNLVLTRYNGWEEKPNQPVNHWDVRTRSGNQMTKCQANSGFIVISASTETLLLSLLTWSLIITHYNPSVLFHTHYLIERTDNKRTTTPF